MAKSKKTNPFVAQKAMLEENGYLRPYDVIWLMREGVCFTYNVDGFPHKEGQPAVNQKAVDLILTPGSTYYGELEPGSVDEANAYACGLRIFTRALFFPDKIKFNSKTLAKFNRLLEHIKGLNNPHVKNYLNDGSGWRNLIGSKFPLSEAKLAVLATYFTTNGNISVKENLNWHVPNVDSDMTSAGYDAYKSMIASYETAARVAEQKEEARDVKVTETNIEPYLKAEEIMPDIVLPSSGETEERVKTAFAEVKENLENLKQGENMSKNTTVKTDEEIAKSNQSIVDAMLAKDKEDGVHTGEEVLAEAKKEREAKKDKKISKKDKKKAEGKSSSGASKDSGITFKKVAITAGIVAGVGLVGYGAYKLFDSIGATSVTSHNDLADFAL